jgi:hypothetical protein
MHTAVQSCGTREGHLCLDCREGAHNVGNCAMLRFVFVVCKGYISTAAEWRDNDYTSCSVYQLKLISTAIQICRDLGSTQFIAVYYS